MKMFSYRVTFFISFLFVIMLIGVALYIEKYDGISPCPLCLLQRFDLIILGILFFIGAILPVKKIGRFFIALLTTLMSLLGLVLAGRQVWLQHLPPNDNVDCGVSLQYLIHVLPFDQVISKIFQGSAECTKTGWEWLHLSLAEWSLLWFGLFFIISLLQLKNALQRKK